MHLPTSATNSITTHAVKYTHLALKQQVFLAAVFSCYTNQQQIIITTQA